MNRPNNLQPAKRWSITRIIFLFHTGVPSHKFYIGLDSIPGIFSRKTQELEESLKLMILWSFHFNKSTARVYVMLISKYDRPIDITWYHLLYRNLHDLTVNQILKKRKCACHFYVKYTRLYQCVNMKAVNRLVFTRTNLHIIDVCP